MVGSENTVTGFGGDGVNAARRSETGGETTNVALRGMQETPDFIEGSFFLHEGKINGVARYEPGHRSSNLLVIPLGRGTFVLLPSPP